MFCCCVVLQYHRHARYFISQFHTVLDWKLLHSNDRHHWWYKAIRICSCFFLLIIQIPGSRIRRKALTPSLYSQMRWKWKSKISIHLFQSISFESFRASCSILMRRSYTENFHSCSSLLRGQGSAPIKSEGRCISLDCAPQRRNKFLFGIEKKTELAFQIKSRTDLIFFFPRKKRSINWVFFFSCTGMFWCTN